MKQIQIGCGRSSVVEYRLPKPWVASSNLVARSSKLEPSSDSVGRLFHEYCAGFHGYYRERRKWVLLCNYNEGAEWRRTKNDRKLC